MKQARWIVVAILIGVLGVMAWLFLVKQREAKSPASVKESPVQRVTEPVVSTAGTDLSQLLPTGPVVVVHYRGGEQLKSAYEQSALGQVFNDPRMQAFLQKPRESMYRQLSSQTNAPPADVVEQLHHWLVGKESVLAVYVAQEPAVAVCVRLGEDAVKAQGILQTLIKGAPSSSTRTVKGHPVTVMRGGGQFVVAKDLFAFASDAGRMEALLDRIDSGSTGSEALKPPALDVGEQIAWVMMDTPLALQKARESIKEPDAAAKAAAKLDSVLKELGAEGIGRIELAAGFDGAGIRVAARIPGLAADRGLLAWYGAGSALDTDSLRLIPKDVSSASAALIRLPAVWDTVMGIAETAAGPDEFKRFKTKLAEFEAEAQVHLKEDLVDSTGDLFIFYSKAGPSPVMGGEMAMALGLKDPQKFGQGMNRLLDYANNQLSRNPQSSTGMSLAIQRSKVGDLEVRYLAGLPMFSPAFAVSGSHAFLAISPMALNAAIAQAGSAQQSLLDNPDFQKSRGKLPGKVVAVAYENTGQIMAGLYGMIGMIGPMFPGKPDAPIDLALLPPLASIQEKLFGGVIVVTADGGAIVTRQYSSIGLNLSSFAGGGAPIIAAMVLPALNQAREKARQASCMSNLKQIGLACHMYAEKHDGKFPAKLEDLTAGYLPSSKVFQCPSAVGGQEMSYVYFSGRSVNDPGKILAYDADNNHRGQGRNVLFGDGHVQWMAEPEFQSVRPRDSR